MSLFYHEEPPNNSSKRCKFLSSTLKEAFSHCHTFRGRRLSLSEGEEEEEEEDDPTNDFDHEQEEVVSEIRTRAMEAKSKRKTLIMESFFWVCSPTKGELLFINPNEAQQKKEGSDGEEREDEFLSADSCFSRSSSCTNMEAFLSVRTIFSSCSSLNGIEFQDFWRGSIIKELCHCEGWPFGLCRKALLLPPLPKSPAESWSWRKRVFGATSASAIRSQKNFFLTRTC